MGRIHAVSRLSAIPTSPPVTAAAIGLLLGVLTRAGQSVLAGGWLILVNSGALWATCAFLSSALIVPGPHPRPRLASHTGTAVLVGLMAGYYAAAGVLGVLHAPATILVWILAAAVAGPVFGIAGSSWLAPAARTRQVAIALLASVLVAEGVHGLLWIDRSGPVWWALLVGGLLAPPVMHRSWWPPLRTYALLLGMVPVLGFGYWLIDVAVAGDILSSAGTPRGR